MTSRPDTPAPNSWATSKSMRRPAGCSSNSPTCSARKPPSTIPSAVLDQGIERAKQLQSNQPQWNQGKKQIHAYYSEIDGAVLPYGVTLPENYDPAKPTRLYVWLHGRQNNTTEAEFIYGFLRPPAARECPGCRSGTDPARLLRPHQWRGLALGRRNGRLRVHRRRKETLQYR